MLYTTIFMTMAMMMGYFLIRQLGSLFRDTGSAVNTHLNLSFKIITMKFMLLLFPIIIFIVFGLVFIVKMDFHFPKKLIAATNTEEYDAGEEEGSANEKVAETFDLEKGILVSGGEIFMLIKKSKYRAANKNQFQSRFFGGEEYLIIKKAADAYRSD